MRGVRLTRGADGASLPRAATTARRRLSTRIHAVFELADDLLLVFKPRGHREDAHAHRHRQRLCVLRGTLVVRTAGRSITLRPNSRPLMMPAGRVHATMAVEDTWLIVESPAPRRPRRRAPRPLQ